MQKNYERMTEETALAYEAFCTYRDIGAGRSHAKVAEILEKPVSYVRQLKQWSSQYHWIDNLEN